MRPFIVTWLPSFAILLLADREDDIYKINKIINVANYSQNILGGLAESEEGNMISKYYFRFQKYTSKDVSKKKFEKPGEKMIYSDITTAQISDSVTYECATNKPLPDELMVSHVQFVYCDQESVYTNNFKRVYGTDNGYDGNSYGFVNGSSWDFTRAVFVTMKTPLIPKPHKCCVITVVNREQKKNNMIRWTMKFIIRKNSKDSFYYNLVGIWFSQPFRILALKMKGDIKEEIDNSLDVSYYSSASSRGYLCMVINEPENMPIEMVIILPPPKYPILDEPVFSEEKYKGPDNIYTDRLYVTTNRDMKTRDAECKISFKPPHTIADGGPTFEFEETVPLKTIK